MKRFALIAVLGLASLPSFAQTHEEVLAQIREFHECFFNNYSSPEPHDVQYTLSSGKVVSAIAQNDYERSAFVSVDQTLREVLEWKESPYLWQLKHRKEGTALMDKKDLTSWEVESFDQIAQSYFGDSNSTFHIASHGLINPDGSPSNRILMGGQELDAKETAELILQSMQVQTDKGAAPFDAIINAEKQNFVIVVHSCHSAEGENNFAQQLSRELSKHIDNVSVVGAPDVVWCGMDEKGNYNEFISSKSEAKKTAPKKQAWKVYKNGKDTRQGKEGYSETVKAIQSTSMPE